MTTRSVHLVGTLPAGSAMDAFAWVTSILGHSIGPTMPDGETGLRREGLERFRNDLRSHPDLEAAGDPPVLRVRRGHSLRWLDLDYAAEFEKSWPVYEEMVAGSGRRLQVGIPGHLDVATVAFGFNLAHVFRNLVPFREATIREMGAVWGRGGSHVVYQLELPVAVRLVSQTPALGRPAVARRLAREVLHLVEAAPREARLGLHLCSSRQVQSPSDAGAVVALANAIMAEWPRGRVLEYVHASLAADRQPASLDPDYYAPLVRLGLPPEVRFVGGFIHEDRTIKEQLMVRDQIEHVLERPIDVAASCGLGGRRRPEARKNLEIAKAVAEAS